MGCAIKCVVYAVFIFNFLLLLLGIGVLVIGLLLQLNVIDYVLALSHEVDPLETVPIVLIALGGVLISVSVLGCCGAGYRNVPLLIIYIIILVLIFVLQICTGIFVLFKINCETEIRNNLSQQLHNNFARYNETEIQNRVDNLQARLECCGVESPQDWANFPANGTLPLSCCERTATECRIELAFPSSCLDRVFESLARGIKITYILAFCIAVIEAVGIIFASVLISSIKNERRRHRYAKYTRSS